MSTPETTKNGIPLDPAKAVEMVKAKQIEICEDSSEVESGPLYETFNITVKDPKGGDDLYNSGGPLQPFYWVKVGSPAAMFEAEGAELDDAAVEALNVIFSSDKNAKAAKSLVATYNSVQRANAKQLEYSRINNLFKPMDEETKAKKLENSIALFANIMGVSLQTAREKLQQTHPELFK